MNSNFMTSKTKALTPDRGWGILGTGAGILVIVIMVILGAQMWADHNNRSEWKTLADQTSRFAQAVRNYTGRYYDTLLGSTSTTTPVIVTVDMLKNTGFLEQGFGSTNSYGQLYQAALVRNATNTDELQGMVVTQGGIALPWAAMRQISRAVTPGLGGYTDDNITVTGAMNMWTMPLSGFGIGTGQGHLAVLLTSDELSAARDDTDRLYRFQVTGKPDLNKMHTSIDMGANDLNNTGTVNAQTGNFSGNVSAGGTVNAGSDVNAGGGVTAAGNIRSTGGWLVNRGNAGWLNETYGGGFYMSDSGWLRSVNDKGVYTGGQLQGGTVRSNGRLSTGEALQLDGVFGEGAGCSPNGLFGRDGSGEGMSCKDGVWTKLGGTNTNIAIYQCPYSICDNNSASTCGGQLSTQNYCQCRQSGSYASCSYVGKLLVSSAQ